MRILTVHDRKEVTEEISRTLNEKFAGRIKHDEAEDCVSAKEMLHRNLYDVLIVDLTLPNIKGRKADYANASNLLEEIVCTDTVNTPGDIIGLTRDVIALDSIRTNIGPHIMTLIEEKADGEWKTTLCDKIQYIERAATKRQKLFYQQYLYDVLIVTALDKEQKPYDELLSSYECEDFPGAREFLFTDKDGFQRKGIRFSIGRSGQAYAASFSQSLISFFKPRFALMSGYCGGIRSKVKLGDLLFFETSYDWDYGKWYEPGSSDGLEYNTEATAIFKARPTPIHVPNKKVRMAVRQLIADKLHDHSRVLDVVRIKSGQSNLNINFDFCPAASGSAVVANEEISSRIRGMNDSIKAVDMESYGFYSSCYNTHAIAPDYLCVKAVSDFCNGEKDDSYHEACCYLSAAAVIELIQHRLEFQHPPT